MRTITFSEISAYLTCRQRHWFEYVMRLPRKPVPHMEFGTMVHIGFEAAMKAQYAGLPWEPAAGSAMLAHKDKTLRNQPGDVDVTELSESLTEAMAVAIRALHWLKPELWETATIGGKPAIEIELEIPLADGIKYRCHQDWVARNKQTGQWWAWEFKTRKTLPTVELGEVSLQQALYQYVLHQNGIFIEGAMEFAILAALPKEPKVNKNGTISRAACATDWDTYKSAVLANHGDPAEYKEMRVQLEAKEWFRMIPQYRTIDECKRTWDAVAVPIAHELTHNNVKVVPILARHICRQCSYIETCLEKVRGYHVAIEITEEVEADGQ